MCLMSFSLALVVLGFQLDSSYGVLLAVQKYTNIDYVFEVNASLQFNFSESGFIQGTAQLPCQRPTKCVEFYPDRIFEIKTCAVNSVTPIPTSV
nr:unnamed protein product [Spirometra erinaceieuropaei]